MKIDLLEWDSNFFGYKVGKLSLNSSEVFDQNTFLSRSKTFKLVYIFSDTPQEFAAIPLVDTKILYHQELNILKGCNSINSNLSSYDPLNDDFLQLRLLARESGIFSRFFVDQSFRNSEFERLYDEWITQSVNRVVSTDVIIYKNESQIQGFATLNNKDGLEADIGLVAVHEGSRGKGIGSLLIEEAINRATTFGCRSIEVATQETNLAANKLYIKNRFTIKKRTFIYHHWNHDTF